MESTDVLLVRDSMLGIRRDQVHRENERVGNAARGERVPRVLLPALAEIQGEPGEYRGEEHPCYSALSG